MKTKLYCLFFFFFFFSRSMKMIEYERKNSRGEKLNYLYNM